MNTITKINPDWTSIDTPVEHSGTKIVLPGDPGDMPYDAAIQTLERVKAQEEQKFDAHELIKGAPWDAAVAVYKAMQNIYGVVLAQSQMTFFGEIKPDMITIQTGPNPDDRVQVPMGSMSLPNVSEPVFVHLDKRGVVIHGTVRRRDRAILVQIANEARRVMRQESVYRGKAIRLKVDSDGDLVVDNQPDFLNLDGVTEGDMIHTRETEMLIRTNMFSPIKNTEACRKHKIPLKRGILLEGRYGTGKSLTARVAAKVATDHGWTFIMLDRAQGLRSAIEFAQTYQPCMIFAEDIDRCADREDEDVNDLVNMLDGLLTKDSEMMVVLTTNFIEKIDKALLRPGRFDAVISIQPPDAETAERLIHTYARGLLAEDADLSDVADIIAGWIPATIREVVERAKLAMLTEGRSNLEAQDLQIAGIGMKRHMELLENDEAPETPGDRLYGAFEAMISAQIHGDPDNIAEILSQLINTGNMLDKIGNTVGQTYQVARAAAHSSNKGLEATKEVLEHVS